MANQFDQSNAPSKEPTEITVGSFVHWKRADFDADYPASEYTLELTARSENQKEEIKLSSSAASDGSHYFSASSSTTAAWIAGKYHYQVEVQRTSDSERIFLYRGRFEIKSDLDENAVDPRSHAKKTLDAIEAVIEGRASKDVQSYSIAGRSITKIPLNELIEMRSYYQQEVAEEERKEKQKSGQNMKTTVGVRFT